MEHLKQCPSHVSEDLVENKKLLGAFLVDAEASNSILNSVNSHCISLDTVSRIIMLCGPACDALSPDGFIKWLKDKMMDDPRIMDKVFAMPDLKKTIRTLEHCIAGGDCQLYCDKYFRHYCEKELMADALSLLKEQQSAYERGKHDGVEQYLMEREEDEEYEY